MTVEEQALLYTQTWAEAEYATHVLEYLTGLHARVKQIQRMRAQRPLIHNGRKGRK